MLVRSSLPPEKRLKTYAQATGKPVLASWMGGAEVASGDTILNRAGIPTFPYPDAAAQTFDAMWRYLSNLQSIYETPLPALTPEQGEPDRELVAKLIETAHTAGRTLLTEAESKQVLAAYGIPTVQTLIATSEDEAVRSTREIQLILGSSIDPQFGPVLLFGSGGQLVEVYRDRAVAIPPLTTTLARRMMGQSGISTLILISGEHYV